MVLVPLYAKTVIDRFVPLFSVILGESMCLIGVIVGTYTGTFTVAGPIIQALAIDVGLQTTQIANRAAIYTIEHKARNRLNTVYMVAAFSGQLMGTGVGNKVYAQGGWIQSGSASAGFICTGLVISLVRSPLEACFAEALKDQLGVRLVLLSCLAINQDVVQVRLTEIIKVVS
ncbi:MAG: hypothetical protein FRX48_02618 [Lasallia pustulata]|uniref:Major facilitator superfamily domain, general substrate transporter n=1 Tax=Lasallia pustulata TaxID=136370 RepID=A0A5M8PX63_9LECA|nr:MAG: hypothetical protein FRX48_02618 [Lasallia pustulata]